MDLLELRTGQTVLVVGAGTMGLTLLQLLRSGGASRVDVVDTNATKLNVASELGASRQSRDPRQLDSGRGWDVVVDATGSLSAIRDGLARVARGGTFLQFGVAVPGGRVEIDPHRIYDDELRILGAVCPSSAYRRAVTYLASGRFDVEPLISHRLPLEEYPGAIEAFGRGETKKVLIQPNG
jgi:threonine dehydrogenase-like Zn-dependent dehydrogenase